MKDTSQHEQLIHIINLFGGYDVVKSNSRFALEIGAFDGVTNSNVNALFNVGWKGIAVEPDPVSFKKLEDLYKNNDNVDAFSVCIHNEDFKIVDFYCVNEKLQYNDRQLSTLSKKFSDNINSERKTTAQPIQISAYSLHGFYQTFINEQVDYMSMDCECYDEKIILYNNFSIFRPRVIQAEFQYDKKIKDIEIGRMAAIYLNDNSYDVYSLPNSEDILAIDTLNCNDLNLDSLKILEIY